MHRYVIKKYGIICGLILSSVCFGMATLQLDLDGAPLLGRNVRFVSRGEAWEIFLKNMSSDEKKEFDFFEHSSVVGFVRDWDYYCQEYNKARNVLKQIQEELHCYPDYVHADFVKKDDNWHALCDQMSMLVKEFPFKQASDLQHKILNSTPLSPNEMQDVKEINRLIPAAKAVRAKIESEKTLWDNAANTMRRLIARKEKKCIVM